MQMQAEEKEAQRRHELYPDPVPRRRTFETVDLYMYSRLGVPEEVLSDLGAQFVSECMQEVSRLLSITVRCATVL